MNTTGKYMRLEKPQFGRHKSGRLFSFNSENGGISVDLEFSVPFIELPVKESLQMAKGAVANINVGALVLSGAVVLVIGVLGPLIISLISKKMIYQPQFGGFQRSEDTNVWRYVTILDDILLDNNIDTTSCMQRMVCWTVKNSAKKVSNGLGSSNDKIIDGIASNEWVTDYIKGSAVFDAVENAYKGINCSKQYGKCHITEYTIQGLTTKFIKMINGNR
ncbi:uncharacterized protein LOC126266551 [Aethina tumida]|uniref:uncharacterized protein LOC126266551 n=1 Tax=Aethina tumida TaxID=116153 RepID=UPI002149140F|nr:uncharacterized protein LOC126266551 [Aethina tumida]